MAGTSNETPRLMRLWEVMELVGVPKETLLLWIRRGDFPKPLVIGPRARAWRQDEINAWIQTRERAVYKDQP